MNKENAKYLVEKFPVLYQDYGGDPRKTCMAWGFSCGDGWFDIIKELSEKLEPYGVVASQVKEKFGGLRFYVQSYPRESADKIESYIQEAEEKSLRTCESCGAPGRPRGNGWITTLCNECMENRSKKRLK